MGFDGARNFMSSCKDDSKLDGSTHGPWPVTQSEPFDRPLQAHDISCSALNLDRARRSQYAATREARGRAGNDVSSPFAHLLDLRSSPSPLPSSKATIDVDLLELINHPFHSTCNLTFAIRQIRSIPLYHLDILIYTHA